MIGMFLLSTLIKLIIAIIINNFLGQKTKTGTNLGCQITKCQPGWQPNLSKG